ncbi:T9SS type A sorting domain-containing protein [Spirosoma sp. KNUC1025]|uniref:T9SS type A sorting domain-containing protein n=1 Tax=Spirosoma sp. KNUC1025 TaxID=2894082 RepID=UPI00386BDFC4|nr:T9SS type A sorting domain-containing protein [Spirosoma sp. KNUC1025]
MNAYARASKIIGFLLLPLVTLAQIQVSFPTSRAVFQRDKSNQATIRITGYYTNALTRIEARLQARDGQGVSTDWRTIQDNATGGVYAGDISGNGGWYNLEVRGMNGSQQVGNTTTIERVGIGEVFIIAGQSNGQGIHQSSPNPGNDRVNCVNYQYPGDGFPNDPPTPVFTKLDNSPGFIISPRGVGSWCWGQLGDLLVNRLNVPVMFFNAAFSGTPVQNWRQSAPEGGIAYSVYNGQPYPPRQPYINLKIALQFYANVLGVRAVLWHQGEADNLLNTPTGQYVSDLQYVINQARKDYNRNMSWVVARASYGDFLGGSDPAVTGAQDVVINSTGNVFAGPNTDGIQIPRKRPPLFDVDGLHFDYDGLVEVANAWNTSLNDSFFSNSNPVSPSPSPTISVACAGSNNLRITVNGAYSSVQWESGESGNTITKGGGTYRAKVKDNLGNTFFTSQVNVPSLVAAVADNGLPYVCAGNSLNLTTNYSDVTWINQQNNTTVSNSQTFSTNLEGSYYVRYRDVSGCDFTSNVLNVSVKPLPGTPSILNDKPTTFCQGDNTILRTETDNVRYNWSDGQQNKSVSIGNSGAYYLTVTDQFGCTSARSNIINVTANPVPVKPVITANGPTTFCADRNVTLTAPQNVSYQWTSGQTGQSITINESGNFAVRTTNQFGCTSVQSDIVAIKVNPLPPSPAVSASGATTFCEGNQVTLTASSLLDVVWSSGQSEKNIVVTSSGNYAAQARDQIGCLSPYSTIIAVKVNPLPATPTILANPDRIICDESQVALRVEGPYTVFWSTGDSTQRITTGSAGTYTAKVRDVNGCISAQAGSIAVELRPLPDPPTINIIGTYTLEAISSSNGTQFRWYRGTDSLAFQTAIIKANQSGTYTARSSTIYSPILTCFSHPSAPLSFTIDLSNRGLSVYPNPNPNKIVILETQDNLVNATITLFTLTGQQVFTTTVPSFDERKQLVLSGLPSGSYLLRVQSADFDVSKRILLGL